MDPIEKQERQREAQRRLRSQRRRAGLLRSRVIVVSLVSFALLWGVVFVQMATGNDPVLGDSSSRIAKGSTHRHRHPARSMVENSPSTDSVEPETSGTGEAEFEQLSEEPAEEEFVEEEPAPVTTSQS
jgi:cytoskeletal protein RodZ